MVFPTNSTIHCSKEIAVASLSITPYPSLTGHSGFNLWSYISRTRDWSTAASRSCGPRIPFGTGPEFQIDGGLVKVKVTYVLCTVACAAHAISTSTTQRTLRSAASHHLTPHIRRIQRHWFSIDYVVRLKKLSFSQASAVTKLPPSRWVPVTPSLCSSKAYSGCRKSGTSRQMTRTGRRLVDGIVFHVHVSGH